MEAQVEEAKESLTQQFPPHPPLVVTVARMALKRSLHCEAVARSPETLTASRLQPFSLHPETRTELQKHWSERLKAALLVILFLSLLAS